ncbi:hypothetical protein [Amycolatopsis sp.]|uniref:hypothetical protein n=1 Tax=Amycolatopsis sp. TaxID=37632 RepID=UPI002D06BCD2|nr:hypothetical protein [Amycolatopsis sp.]HVV09014.1 hypothetical protein [Amycolatopsis sp.]
MTHLGGIRTAPNPAVQRYRLPAPRPRAPLGGLGVPQLVCWQLALMVTVLALRERWAVFAVVVFGAAILVLLASVRMRGHWLYEWLFLGARYALRRFEHDLRDAGGSGRALLRALSPEAVSLVHHVGEEPVFMLSRITGITVVLRPETAGRELAVPPPGLLLPPVQDVAFTAQVVHHAGIGPDRPLRSWLALQARRTVDVYQDAEMRQALGNALRRVRRGLQRSGLRMETLPENEFFSALASLAHVTAGRHHVREDWRLFYSGPVSQTTFQLVGWAGVSPAVAPQLLHRLLTVTPYAAVTVAVSASRETGTEPEAGAALRIAAADPAALEHATDVLTRVAGEWAVGLVRLDGRHGHGMVVTLPLGVPASEPFTG